MLDYLDKYHFSKENEEQNYLIAFESKIINELIKLVDNDYETIFEKLQKKEIYIRNSLYDKHKIDKIISFEKMYNEVPCHSIILGNLPKETTKNDIKCIADVFGETKNINYNELANGKVEIKFYNIKDSMFMRTSKISIKNKSIMMSFGKPLAASKNNKKNLPNNGTIVIFNLPEFASNDEIYQFFSRFGEIRDIYNAPTKGTQRFIEYYDLRDAFYARKMMNNKSMKICGIFYQIKIHYSFYLYSNFSNYKIFNHLVPSIERR